MPLDMLTPKELAKLTGIQLRTITRLASVGEIPAVKVGRQWRFIRSDVEEWIRSQASNQRRRILVVEDDPEFLRMLGHLVRKLGHEVVTAENGVKAVEALRENGDFDLMILDLLLPLVDGPGVMEWMSKKGLDIDVLIITAHANSDLMAQALGYRHLRVLRKPVAPKLIQKAIRTCLEGVDVKVDLVDLDSPLQEGRRGGGP